MTSQPDQPEHEQQPEQAGDEPKSESLIDDPDFHAGFAKGISPLSGDVIPPDEPYLIRNRGRAMQSWAQEGAPTKGLWVLLGIVGGALTLAMLLLT